MARSQDKNRYTATPVDRDRFEELVKQHYRPLYQYAYRLTNCRTGAEDLTQETFIRAYRRIETYDASRPFKNWLGRIAYNLFVDSLRARRPVPALSLDALMENDEGDTPVSLQIADSQHDPERLLTETVMDERLERALASLPIEFRTPIALCDLQGLSYEEIAGMLNCSVGTVRSRLHRGRKMLREAYAEVQQGWETLPRLAFA
jgi:RNA polymerase sigma-70 factor (ECF subfamily)